jgi:hypothetical protein
MAILIITAPSGVTIFNYKLVQPHFGSVVHSVGSIKELTLESNGRRWLSRVSVSSSSGPSGLSKELEHKTEEEKENCQANEKPNNGGYGCLSKGTRRICNQMNIDND